MGDLTKYFDFADYACGCGCGLCRPHPYLVVGDERFRALLNKPVWVTSGSRCHEWNNHPSVGGSEMSWHLPHMHEYTYASDKVVPGVRLADMMEAAERVIWFRTGGIGLYLGVGGNKSKRFIHTDVRGNRARWCILDGKMVTLEEIMAADEKRVVTWSTA